jgi:hypothetical protein
MRKITISGLEIECDDTVDITIEGNKLTIKAVAVDKQVHEHHYHYTTINSPQLAPPIGPLQPYIGDPIYPGVGGGGITWGTFGNTATAGGPDMPFSLGFVMVNPPPGILPNTNAAALTFSVQ